MRHHQRSALALCAGVIALLPACSSSASTASPSAQATALASTPPSGTTESPPTSAAAVVSSSPASTPAVATSSPVPAKGRGGGATDFCGAFKEFNAAVEAGTPQAEGAGFRAAAADLRAFAPAEIKASAGMFADLMDEVGKAIQSGQTPPEVLGSGQSAERRQALADSVSWVGKHCPQ